MDKCPRLIPVWLWVTAIIIIVLLCSSCRGGRSLGNGSAGTVIVPQTPQQINERNRPHLEPLPPIPLVQPPVVPLAPKTNPTPARSTPTPPKHTPIKANPIIIDPKPAGEATPFTPTINDNTPLPNVNIKTPPTKLIEGDGGCVKPLPTDNKATTPEIAGPSEAVPPAKSDSFNWLELSLNYLLFILLAVFIWTIYDIIKRRGNTKPKKGCGKKDCCAIKVKKKTIKKSTKKKK